MVSTLTEALRRALLLLRPSGALLLLGPSGALLLLGPSGALLLLRPSGALDPQTCLTQSPGGGLGPNLALLCGTGLDSGAGRGPDVV